MIIEFSAANFRSIRERQTLSMVAATRDGSLPDNVIDVSLPGLSKTRLLKSAVLYGPNASGKSNVLKALHFMDWFVEESATGIKPEAPTEVEPFLLDKDSREKPSEFEIMFVDDGVRYQFGFTLNAARVLDEWLYGYPKGKRQCWYERRWNPDKGVYELEFSQTHFRGNRETLRSQTRPNALLLSTGAQLNHEQLGKIYLWFKRKLCHLDLAEYQPYQESLSTAVMMRTRESMREKVPKLLQHADLGICGLNVVLEEFDEQRSNPEMVSDIREFVVRPVSGRPGVDTQWLHRIAGSEDTVTFDSDQESAGTRRYFSVIGPFLRMIETGRVQFVDELGANIHPSLVRGLLRMVSSKTENPLNAQLVFTTHDITLLDKGLFRRDQIWFTEKDQDGATKLYPLTDYQPRKDESLAKGYLAGRYGAIPFLSGELAL